MNLENIYYLSQTISSIAVVGSLIYLGLQVRYAERSQRGLMQQARADRTAGASLATAQPELVEIWARGMAGDLEMTPTEVAQWFLICRSAFLSGEDSVLQYKAGLLSKDTFETYVAGARTFMARPGFRAAWKLSRSQFGPEFRKFTDAIVDEVPVSTVNDSLAEWKSLIRAETGATP